MLLDLEKEVVAYAAMRGLPIVPRVSPAQLHGLEINTYAQELAQVVIWIGYLQWMHFNGFKMPDHPVLTPIETIKQMDAILDLSDPEHPKEPEWPVAEFIVGNPPFLGDKKLARGLATRTLSPCSACTETECRTSRTYAVTGLSGHDNKSRPASRNASGFLQLRVFVVAATAECWNG